ncbi:MAG: pilus assembly protein TadG-related protein [Pseudomonadota bacterium]|nr:pilus assembly protein TadG-related protein [Pseudomonadota bacterium]
MSVFRRFCPSTNGNVAMLFALAVLPLMACVGFATDYGLAVNYEGEMQLSADVASVGAISIGSKGFEAALAQQSPGRVTAAEEQARLLFMHNFQRRGEDDFEITPVVERKADRVVSTINYRIKVPTLFGAFYGKADMEIHGRSIAEIEIAKAIDFYMLLDNTPSMGVGATQSDIDKMVANTDDKCAFACHQTNTTNNYYNLAKSLGVKMRIDVVRTATQRLTETAEKSRQKADQYRMAVYSFGARAETMGLTPIATLSSNMTQVRSQTASLDLMTIPYPNYFDDQLTAFDDTLKALKTVIPTPGSGYGGDEPDKYMFFVSDGVADHAKGIYCTKRTTPRSVRCQEPIDTKYCDQIKKKGIKIAVLYTTYLPLPTNGWYRDWIMPFQNQIAPQMQACASPGLFFEVSPSQGIEAAMKALFEKTIASAHLTH